MKKVLITEDDALMAEIYRDSFEREGFSAEIAADGDIAIQLLKGNPPDLTRRLLAWRLPPVHCGLRLTGVRSPDSCEA